MKLSPTGSPSAPIFVCGEAGGQEEFRRGQPFVGGSGRVLWTALQEAGISRSDCYVTNVCMHEIRGKNPTAAEISEEWDRLDAELFASRATTIFCVGGISLKRITGLGRGIDALGNYILTPDDCIPSRRRVLEESVYKTSRRNPDGTFKYRKGDVRWIARNALVPRALPPTARWIIGGLHPAAIMRAQFTTTPALRAACARVKASLAPDFQPLSTPPYLRAVTRDTVAIDIETEGESIREVSIATVDGAEHYFWGSEAQEVIHQLFNSSKTLVFHNAAFDVPRLELWCGECKAPIRDTMLEAQHLCPDLRKGLESVAPRHLVLRPWKETSIADPEGYNRKDAWYTALLADELGKEITAARQWPTIQRMQKAMPTLWAASRRGIRVDTAYQERWLAGLEARVSSIISQWPYPHVDLTKPQQVARLLYVTWGLPPQFTEKEGWSTEESALRMCLENATSEEQTFAIDLLLQYRGSVTNLRTWAKLATPNGRIHPEYVPQDKEPIRGRYWASTGRIQPRNPNIANPDRDARRLCLPEPGERFFEVDWKKAEARIEAVCSGDEALLAAIEAGLHDEISKRLGISKLKAKNLWYGTGRFAGPRKLVKVFMQDGVHITVGEGQEMQEELFKRFPKWARWRTDLVTKAKALGYGENPFGRRRYFYGVGQAPEVVGNFPQSTVADMLYIVIPMVGHRLVAPLHDATLTSVAGERDIEAVTQAMLQPFDVITPGFTCPIDCKLGLPDESWGDMEERHEREKQAAPVETQ